MGEKEQGAARESSAPSLSERDAQSGKAGGIAGDPDFDTARAAAIKSSKSNTSDRQQTGDPDDDGDGTLDDGPLSVVKTKTKSNQSNDRVGREDGPDSPDDPDDDGDGTLDEGPLSVLKNKTKSNQSNDRLGREDDPDSPDDQDDADARTVTKTSSNIQNNREAVPDGPRPAERGPVRIDPTPARVSEGGGNDIAIGDPGVNG